VLPRPNWLSSQTFPQWRSAIDLSASTCAVCLCVAHRQVGTADRCDAQAGRTMASHNPLPRCARRGRTFRTDAVVAVGGIGVGVGAGGNAPHALTDSATSPKPFTNRNDRWRFMVCSSRPSWYDRELADPPRLPRAAQRRGSPAWPSATARRTSRVQPLVGLPPIEKALLQQLPARLVVSNFLVEFIEYNNDILVVAEIS
jgi:hypothetical protein